MIPPNNRSRVATTGVLPLRSKRLLLNHQKHFLFVRQSMDEPTWNHSTFLKGPQSAPAARSPTPVLPKCFGEARTHRAGVRRAFYGRGNAVVGLSQPQTFPAERRGPAEATHAGDHRTQTHGFTGRTTARTTRLHGPRADENRSGLAVETRVRPQRVRRTLRRPDHDGRGLSG